MAAKANTPAIPCAATVCRKMRGAVPLKAWGVLLPGVVITGSADDGARGERLLDIPGASEEPFGGDAMLGVCGLFI